MNILIFTEQFLFGGLETHIIGQIKALKQLGNKVYFAAGKVERDSIKILDTDGYLINLQIGPDATSDEIFYALQKLQKFVNEKEISFIHVHPYTSLLPAVFLSNISSIPIVITLHGPGSLQSVYGALYDKLIRTVILPEADHIFCVSDELNTLASMYTQSNKCSTLPNAVDIDLFKPASIDNRGNWCIVSRIDEYKVHGIKDFIYKANKAGIKCIHLYGDGNGVESLKDFIIKEDIQTEILFKGITNKLYEDLREGYIGIAGMGRVVLEGLSMGLPTILVGYDGVKGLITVDNIEKFKWWNFSGRGFENINQEVFENSIELVAKNAYDTNALRNWIEENANEQIIWKDYYKLITNINFTKSNLVQKVYELYKAHLGNNVSYLGNSELLYDIDDLLVKYFPEKVKVAERRIEDDRSRIELVNSIRSSAMLKQALLDQRIKYEEVINTQQNRITSLESENKIYISSEAMHKQALFEQKIKFEELISSAQNRINTLESENKLCIASEALFKQEIIEHKNKYDEIKNLTENKRINELEDLKLDLNKKLNDLKEQKENEIKGVVEVMTIARHDIEDIRKELIAINSSRSYKMLKLLKAFKDELKTRSIRRVIGYFKKLFMYINGKKGILYEYSNNDSLVSVLNKVTNLSNNLNISTGFGNSILDAESNIPEIRRAIVAASGTGKKRVAYFTNQLLDWFDQRPRYGGGERYCINLADLLREQGFEVDIYQMAPTIFEGDYHGYHVKSIIHGNFYSEFNIDGANEFYNISLNYDHVIYNMPELSSGKMRLDAISICHGIWFDHNNYGPNYQFRQSEWFKYLYRAFNNPKRIVSVDTNSVNVIRSLWPKLAEKMTFIPNFVDHKKFYPSKVKRENSKLKILFPRRSQINRGSRILADILKNVPYDVDFYWVGEGDDYDTQLILDICKQDPRLHYEKASFDEMPEWYRKVDIVIIPTIACEGTSLSCIEALASGCATISTNVGGLTDIIQDRMNGRLVDPNPRAISYALNELIENKDLLEYYQKQGLESSYAFSLVKWKEKWLDVLVSENWIENKQDFNTSKKDEAKTEIDDLKTIIVTRNAYHGGVESLIGLESEHLNAPVIVAGGLNNPTGTCPFRYKYVSTYEELIKELESFDMVLYHWPLDWAVEAIKDSGKPSVEFVHRTDTDECDKSVPTIIVTHSEYVKDHIENVYGRDTGIVPNVVDIEHFKPNNMEKENVIGAVTSYYKTKGIDIFLDAWAMIANKYSDYKVVFYGSGNDLEFFKEKADNLGIDVVFNGPTSNSLEAYNQYKLLVTAARIEGLPIVLLEALACNVPILASDIDGHKIINKMAAEKGLDEPIKLFKSEDPKDLAEKLDRLLASEIKPNVRIVAEEVFSPKEHIESLKKYILEANNSVNKNRSYKNIVVDEHINTGIYANGNKDEGYILYGDIVTQEADKTSSIITSTYDSYIAHRCKVLESADKVSCLVKCKANPHANVFLQYDWCDENDIPLKMEGSGRLVDQQNKIMYMIKEIPQEIKPHIKYLKIVIRPNPGELLEIESIKITMLKKKE